MDSKKFYTTMADALLRQFSIDKEGKIYNEYGDIKSIAIECLKNSDISTSLLDSSCITSRLILGDMLVEDLPKEIDAKSASGQNEATRFNEKAEKINAAIKGLKKCTAENFVDLLNEHEDLVSNKKYRELLCDIISKNDKHNLLSSIFAAAVVSKINNKENLEESKEFEYELEPIIKSLIVNKKVDGKISLYDTNVNLTNEVMAIAKNHADQDKVNSLFHDLITTYHIATTIVGKNSDWAVSLNDNDNRMWFVDKEGKQRKLFHYTNDERKTTFLKEPTAITELLKLNESGIYTAFKRLQKRISGKELSDQGEIDTRFASADRLLQLFATTVFLCDAMKLEGQHAKNLQFAIMNPLTDILHSLQLEKGSAHVNTIISQSLKDAQEILQQEQGISYKSNVMVAKQTLEIAPSRNTLPQRSTSNKSEKTEEKKKVARKANFQKKVMGKINQIIKEIPLKGYFKQTTTITTLDSSGNTQTKKQTKTTRFDDSSKQELVVLNAALGNAKLDKLTAKYEFVASGLGKETDDFITSIVDELAALETPKDFKSSDIKEVATTIVGKMVEHTVATATISTRTIKAKKTDESEG